MIHSVAVLGAGAVGSYVIWGISSLDDVELGVIAEGERAERIKNEGCLINDKVYHPQVWTPKEAKKADLLVVALKYNALLPALPSIKEAVGENTVVMSLMNGVDSEEIIAKEVGDSHLLYSVIKIASHKAGKGFYFAPETTIGIIFGELEAPFDSERVQAIEELFGRTEIHFRATKYIREEVWSKYRLNVCNNLPQAILGAGVGCYRDSVHMKAISDRKNLRQLRWQRESICQRWKILRHKEVPYRQVRDILRCRIWMQEDRLKLRCFPVHLYAWERNLESRHRITSIPII